MNINEKIESEEYEKKLNEISEDLIPVNNENKYVAFFIYFSFNLKNKDFIFQIKSDFFNKNDQYIYELIKNIVQKINEKNIIINSNNKNYILSLKDCDNFEEDNNKNFYIKNYEIKQCNINNNIPLNNILSISPNSLIKNIKCKNLSFISKTPLNIMIREKFE